MHQRSFLKGVELETWKEATETLPEFTQALKKFKWKRATSTHKLQGLLLLHSAQMLYILNTITVLE